VIYTICVAGPEHLPEIPKIEQAAAALFAAEDLPPELRYRVTDSNVLRAAQEEERLWTACDESRRPVGFALAEVADGHAYLAELDVHPEHARRGLGSRLVAAVVDWASERKLDGVLLVTFRHLPWNAPFYARLGFVPLADEELGRDLGAFFEEERQAGIDTAKRVAMRLPLRSGATGSEIG
jgi:GNAT superfamily N-acetyltransferase